MDQSSDPGLQPIEVDTSLPASGVPGIDSPMFGMDVSFPSFRVPKSPTSMEEGGQYGDLQFGGKATGARGDIVNYARQFLGDPYVWGGTKPGAFDCSGFVQYVMKHFNVGLPRISKDQATSGQRIALNKLQPGDLVAWDNSSRNNGADHIAIYIGNGQIIEAPHPGGHVQISKLYDTSEAWGVAMNFG